MGSYQGSKIYNIKKVSFFFFFNKVITIGFKKYILRKECIYLERK